jgi:hypothetical protein
MGNTVLYLVGLGNSTPGCWSRKPHSCWSRSELGNCTSVGLGSRTPLGLGNRTSVGLGRKPLLDPPPPFLPEPLLSSTTATGGYLGQRDSHRDRITLLPSVGSAHSRSPCTHTHSIPTYFELADSQRYSPDLRSWILCT